MASGLLILAAWLSAAWAGDLGTTATLGGEPLAGRLRATGGVLAGVHELQPSDWIAEAFDAVLFQGVCDDPGASFRASRQDSSGAWGPWVAARSKRFADGRFWARVTFPDARAGRVRVRAVGADAGASIEIFSVETYKGSPKEARSISPAPVSPVGLDPSAVKPELVDRRAWGAKPSKEPFDPLVPVRFTQHHTAGKYTSDLAASINEVRFIQDYHQTGRGWNDIGYHYLIDGEGRIFEGRPEDAQGAHVLANNEGNVGISLLGNFHPPYDHPLNAAQREAIRRLGAWLRDRHGVSPGTYRGHRDYGNRTSCPGDGVYSQLPAIEESIRATPGPVLRALQSLGLERLPALFGVSAPAR